MREELEFSAGEATLQGMCALYFLQKTPRNRQKIIVKERRAAQESSLILSNLLLIFLKFSSFQTGKFCKILINYFF